MPDKKLRAEIEQIISEWSPLGDEDPFDPHLPRNEYDWLIRGVERELAGGTDAQRLAAFMKEAVRSRYGLNEPPRAEDAARRLAALRG
jgi:hypothetical protein